MGNSSLLVHPESSTRRGRGWVWFFVVLACLVVVALGIQSWWYNKQRLTPERLAEARALWKIHRPANYDLEYTQKGNATGTFVVQVRDGNVVAATLDGQPLKTRLYAPSDMDGLFDDIERFLEMDSSPGSPRTYEWASFHEKDGHLIRYIRSVMSQGWRLQIDVRLHLLATGAEQMSTSAARSTGGRKQAATFSSVEARTGLGELVRRATKLQ